jgi:excisionase family DNA binding protein
MKCLTVAEAAARIGFSKDSLYRCARRGEIPVVRIMSRVLIDEADLGAIVDRYKVRPARAEKAASA